MYINIVAKTVIVEFKKHYISYDHCYFAFNNDPSDNDNIQNDISQNNKKNLDKSNRVRF